MSSSKVLTVFLVIATMSMIFSLEGCGGGSSGTGFTTDVKMITIEGALLTDDNTPLTGVQVILEETGASTTSDSSGTFSLQTPPISGDAELTFARDSRVSSKSIPVTDEATSVQTVITMTPTLNPIEESSFVMTSKIIEECASYFTDDTPIAQINEVPTATFCTSELTITTGGAPAEKTPLAVQYRACASDSPWITLAIAETGAQSNGAGKGQIAFPFIDDQQRCVYRIVAPFNIDGAALVAKEIHTLSYRNFLGNRDARQQSSLIISREAKSSLGWM